MIWRVFYIGRSAAVRHWDIVHFHSALVSLDGWLTLLNIRLIAYPIITACSTFNFPAVALNKMQENTGLHLLT